MKVANQLQRNSVGYEIDIELKDIIRSKLNITDTEIIVRKDVKRLRTKLQNDVKRKTNKTKKED